MSGQQVSVLPYSLDDYFQTTPLGSIERAIGENLYGINHQQIPSAVPSNKDMYGLTFFVRPQLNLQSDNIRNERLFYPLLSSNATSMQRFVRCMLDPRLIYGYGKGKLVVPGIPCPLVDNQQAFITVLTNDLLSISGWPDLALPTFKSDRGLYNEVYMQADGLVKNYDNYSITASFRNTRGDPILYMFYIWLHYQALVFEGTLVPYPDFIVENELDYNTRIYRLVLDSTKTYVKKIGACGVAQPVSVPTASFFDFNSDKPYNDQNKDISIQFECIGAIYQDDILIDEFNKTVQIFNPSMRDDARGTAMVKMPKALAPLFKNRGYARINPQDYELEWWIDKDLYESRTKTFLKQNSTNPEQQDAEETGD